MAPFQAKIGCKMQRKRENKNFYSVPFRFVPTRREIENSKKIAKMFKKLKKIPFRLHFRPKLVVKRREREKIKIVIPFRSVPT